MLATKAAKRSPKTAKQAKAKKSKKAGFGSKRKKTINKTKRVSYTPMKSTPRSSKMPPRAKAMAPRSLVGKVNPKGRPATSSKPSKSARPAKSTVLRSIKSNKSPKVKPAAQAPKQKPRREKDAFEERITSKVAKKAVAPDPQVLQKIAAILADSRVRQMLIELGGENALALIRNFYGNHSDDDLAKMLKLKISDVRATLNKLHNEGLVNYIREKDSDTGWYSYSWSLNVTRMERWATLQNNRLCGLGSREAGIEYYFCVSCGESSITNFESAAEDDFRCERCNRLLEYLDEKKMLALLNEKRRA